METSGSRTIEFSEDGNSSHIIDFDLAGEEGNLYPAGYVVNFPERHDGARPGHRMLKIHDKHAFVKVINHCFPQVNTTTLIDKEWINELQQKRTCS